MDSIALPAHAQTSQGEIILPPPPPPAAPCTTTITRGSVSFHANCDEVVDGIVTTLLMEYSSTAGINDYSFTIVLPPSEAAPRNSGSQIADPYAGTVIQDFCILRNSRNYDIIVELSQLDGTTCQYTFRYPQP